MVTKTYGECVAESLIEMGKRMAGEVEQYPSDAVLRIAAHELIWRYGREGLTLKEADGFAHEIFDILVKAAKEADDD